MTQLQEEKYQDNYNIEKNKGIEDTEKFKILLTHRPNRSFI